MIFPLGKTNKQTTPTLRQEMVFISLKSRCPRIPDKCVVASDDWQMGCVGSLLWPGFRCFAFLKKEMWAWEGGRGQNDRASSAGGRKVQQSSRCPLAATGCRCCRNRHCLDQAPSECHFCSYTVSLGQVASLLWALADSFVQRRQTSTSQVAGIKLGSVCEGPAALELFHETSLSWAGDCS